MIQKYLVLLLLLLGACSSKKKIENVDTVIENPERVNSSTLIGKNSSGDNVVQEKIKLVDYLLELERQVYTSEETIYGNKSYGNIGKYGALENCLTELRKAKTGQWGMVELPEKNILTKLGGPQLRAGVDEKKNLVMLSEEEITGRIKRFENYKQTYDGQEDWFEMEIKNCTLKLKNKSTKTEPAKPFPKFESGVLTETQESL